MSKNVLTVEEIASYLSNPKQDVLIKVFKSIDSTNSEAKRDILSGIDKDAIYVADEQTAGRGRRGKSFYSPSSMGLYFTAVLRPDASLSCATGLTAAAAVAVCEVIKSETKKDPKIKWVNDIFVDGKKVCGILTEAITAPESDKLKAAVIGIGINLTTDTFPDELLGIAGTLNAKLNRCRLAAELFNRLSELSADLSERKFMDDYRKYSLVLGKSISFIRNETEYTAKAEDILNDGSLKVTTAQGEVLILNSGEISIKPEQL